MILIRSRVDAGWWVSVTPITRAAWSHFVSAGGEGIVSGGADEALRRVGFTWPTRLRAVTSVSWSEARAFCAALGGRLPWLRELRRPDGVSVRWTALVQKLVSQQCLDFDHTDCFINEDGLVVCSGWSEWCEEWYNPHAEGPPMTRPVHPPERSIAWGPFRSSAQHVRREGQGFRFALTDEGVAGFAPTTWMGIDARRRPAGAGETTRKDRTSET